MKKQFRIKKEDGFYKLESKVPMEQIENSISKKVGDCFYIKLCAIMVLNIY